MVALCATEGTEKKDGRGEILARCDFGMVNAVAQTAPNAPREMKLHCEWKTTMPKMRDGGGIGGLVFPDVFHLALI